MTANRQTAIEQFPRCSEAARPTSSPGALESVYITAEDGAKLALDYLLPKDTANVKFPTVLMMTRYWRGTVGGTLDRWQTFYSSHGFAVVSGDVRGTGASFGQWPYHRSRAETKDFTAVMDWVASQPWSDGRIVGTGTSYAANTADWMAERNHPALKVIVPRYADFDPYADLYFPGGVPNVFMGKTWGLRVKQLDMNIKRLKDGTFSPGVRPVGGPEGEIQLQAALAEHAPTPSVWEGIEQIVYRDDRPSSWHGASMTDLGICSHSEAVIKSGVPIQNWAGWWDTGTASGAIHRFLALENSIHTIIGPWSHGGSQASDPLQPHNNEIPPSYPVQQAEALLFIQEALEGRWTGKQKRLSYFTLGEGRWKTTTTWPPADMRLEDWYLGPNGTLNDAPCNEGQDVYKVDFEVGSGTATRWATGQDGTPVSYGDRREIDKRLLCYITSPMEHEMEITGNPIVTLYLSSTEADGAIFAYSELVDPEGGVIYLTEGQIRLLHRRESTEQPLYPHVGPYHSCLRKDSMPLISGEVAEVSFELNPISVLVPAGCYIRLAIAGADKDVFARLPEVGDPVLHVHRSLEFKSRIALPLIGSRPR